MKKQTFIFSSALLIISAAVTKLIGAFFRIPLANMLGGTGMGYFSGAYGIFMTVYAVSVTGLPTAVARLVAENSVHKRYANIRRIKSVALLFFGVMGLSFTILLFIISYPLCMFSGEAETIPSVLMIAPSIFFCCITSVYRGYYEGLRNMFPTAISQIIEGLFKLFVGLALCHYIINNPESTDTIRIMFGNCSITALASAAAVSGISISSAAGTAFLIISDKLHHGGIPESQLLLSETNDSITSDYSVVSQLFKTALPIAAGAFVTNLTSIIDLLTVTRCIERAVTKSPDYFIELTSVSDISLLPNFLYGSFTGLAVTVFNLIPSFTNMFGKGIFPSLAEAFTANDYNAVKRNTEKAILSTALIAMPSGLGIMALSENILEFLFSSKPLETSLTVTSMTILGATVIFLCISSTVFSVLQAVGQPALPVKIMLAGVSVKLACNLLLVPIPTLNITGAAISTLLCYVIMFVISIHYLLIYTKIPKRSLFVSLCKICYCSVSCALSAKLVKNILSNALNTSFVLYISIFTGVIFYILCCVLLGIFTKSTLKLLIS